MSVALINADLFSGTDFTEIWIQIHVYDHFHWRKSIWFRPQYINLSRVTYAKTVVLFDFRNDAFSDDLLPTEVPVLYDSITEEDKENLLDEWVIMS